jgi:hypothetical protein
MLFCILNFALYFQNCRVLLIGAGSIYSSPLAQLTVFLPHLLLYVMVLHSC